MKMLSAAAVVTFLVLGLAGCPQGSPAGETPVVQVKQGSTAVGTTTGYDFGAQIALAPQSSVAFQVKNNTASAVTLDAATPFAVSGTDGVDFAVTFTGSKTIASGSAAAFAIQFWPSRIGTETAQVTVRHDTGSITFPVHGTGAASGSFTLTYSTNGATFNSMPGTTITWPTLSATGTGVQYTFRITNTSATESLGLPSIGRFFTITPNTLFEFQSTLPIWAPLAPGLSADFALTDWYVGAGTYTDTVSFLTSASSTPTTFQISVTEN